MCGVLLTLHAFALRVSFLSGYYTDIQGLRITATPKGELRSQMMEETRALLCCASRFYLATVVLAYRHARSTFEDCLSEGLRSTKYHPRIVCMNLGFAAQSVERRSAHY